MHELREPSVRPMDAVECISSRGANFESKAKVRRRPLMRNERPAIPPPELASLARPRRARSSTEVSCWAKGIVSTGTDQVRIGDFFVAFAVVRARPWRTTAFATKHSPGLGAGDESCGGDCERAQGPRDR